MRKFCVKEVFNFSFRFYLFWPSIRNDMPKCISIIISIILALLVSLFTPKKTLNIFKNIFKNTMLCIQAAMTNNCALKQKNYKNSDLIKKNFVLKNEN